MRENTTTGTDTCATCGEEFPVGKFIAHKIRAHRGLREAPRTHEIPADAEFAEDGALEFPQVTHVSRPRVSPVRVSARPVQAPKRTRGPRTPVVSAKTVRTDKRHAVPARERAIRAELRQARRTMARLERALASTR